MNKILIVADVHGRSLWKLAVHQHQDANKIVFLGDYFDSFNISGLEQLHNFNEILRYRETCGKEVVMLVGNHDHHYFPEVGYSYTSGFQSNFFHSFSNAINENRKYLQMAHIDGEFLFSHAGVSSDYLKLVDWDGIQPIDQFLNDMFAYRPRAFSFNGQDSHGDDPYQTPIWIRQKSLMASNRDTLRKKFVQVVGHTQVPSIDIKGKATGGRYYFVDAQETSGEYVTIEDGIVKLHSLRK